MNSVIIRTIIIRTIIITLIISILFSCSSKNKSEIVDLNCEYVENPLGIDIVKPRLSWKLRAENNNIKQKAYRILVSSNVELLNNNIGDLWDTDTIYSNQSNQIVYTGDELKSRQKVFWKVRIWDQNNIASILSIDDLARNSHDMASSVLEASVQLH